MTFINKDEVRDKYNEVKKQYSKRSRNLKRKSASQGNNIDKSEFNEDEILVEEIDEEIPVLSEAISILDKFWKYLEINYRPKV